MPFGFTLAVGMLVASGLFIFGAWHFVTEPQPSPFASASLALSIALLVLIASTYTVYAIPPARGGRELGVNLVLPIPAYLGVIVYARRRRKVELGGLLFMACVGFVGLLFLGLYTALMVACSFGDCL